MTGGTGFIATSIIIILSIIIETSYSPLTEIVTVLLRPITMHCIVLKLEDAFTCSTAINVPDDEMFPIIVIPSSTSCIDIELFKTVTKVLVRKILISSKKKSQVICGSSAMLTPVLSHVYVNRSPGQTLPVEPVSTGCPLPVDRKSV